MECLVEHDYAAQEEDELSLSKGDVIKSVVTKMDGWWEGSLNGKRGMFPDNFVKVLTTNSGSGDSVLVNATTGANTEIAQMRKKSDGGTHPRRLKAVFSYAPEQDDELGLEVGDIVNFIAEVEEGWWRGELKERIGIFPSNFVQDLEIPVPGEASGRSFGLKSESAQKPKDSNRATVLVKGQGIPDVVPAARTPVSDDEPAPKLPPKPVRESARCFYPYFAQNDDELTLQEGDIVNIISKDCEDEGWFRGELRGKIGLFPDNFVKVITANDPVYTPPLPSAHQPKVTAQERSTDDSISPAGKKERDTPSPAPGIVKLDRDSPSRSNSMNTKSGGATTTTTVVDGAGKSKPETKPTTSTTSSSSFLSKASIFKSNKTKSESFEKKGAAPPTPTPFSAKIKLDTPPLSPAGVDESPQSEDFNSISRGEKLSHLTANRAKAPRRRPPSAIVSPREEHHDGVTNGSADFQPTNNDPAPAEPHITHTHTHTPLSLRNSAGHPAVTPEDRSSPSKEVSPGPFGSSVNKPKQSLPWMAELKQKQDRKSIISINATNNVSNVTVSSAPAPSLTLKESTPSPTPPAITTRAPPLPAKPHVPTVPSPTAAEKSIVPISVPHNSTTNTTVNSTITTTSAIATTTTSSSSVGGKFSYLKRMGVSTPGTAIANNHSSNSHSGSTDAPSVPNNTTPTPTNHHSNANVNPKDSTPEFVPYEEYRKLKEKVDVLETELDLVKKQVKLFLEKDFGKGHIV